MACIASHISQSSISLQLLSCKKHTELLNFFFYCDYRFSLVEKVSSKSLIIAAPGRQYACISSFSFLKSYENASNVRGSANTEIEAQLLLEMYSAACWKMKQLYKSSQWQEMDKGENKQLLICLNESARQIGLNYDKIRVPFYMYFKENHENIMSYTLKNDYKHTV